MTHPRSILAVDIGNSGTKIARVASDGVQELLRFPTGDWGAQAAACSELPDDPVWICSVVDGVTQAAAKLLGGTVIGTDVPLPAQLDYDTPDTLGADRVIAAWAAWQAHPAGAVVVDAGTAMTVDWIDQTGTFRGGAIAPGPGALGAALNGTAPGLDAVDPDPDVDWPGRTTRQSLVAGITSAARGLVRDLVGQACDAAGADAGVVVTGGAALLVSTLMDRHHDVDRDLLMRGIGAVAGL